VQADWLAAMPATTHYPYIILSAFALLLLLHWFWCRYVAYPIAFERHLKQGKNWVYIPLRWKGAHKFHILLLSRLLIILVIVVGIFILSYYSRKSTLPWAAGFGIALGVLVFKLNSLWLKSRYQQQEDAYYFLHDELRVKLESEGKDIADSAFKNLAAYQYQNLLRKADEQGKLLSTLKTQSGMSRNPRKEITARDPVES
jgi:hypothetical protein